jgi:hypothetical protein
MDTSPTPTNTHPGGISVLAIIKDDDSYRFQTVACASLTGITESVARRAFSVSNEAAGQRVTFLALPGSDGMSTHLSFDGTPEQQIRTLRVLARRLQDLATDIEYGSD